MSDDLNALGLLAVFLGVSLTILVVLVIPAIIAFRRQHPNRWLILAVCVFLGATGIGWAIALIWALRAAHLPPDDITHLSGGESGLNLFSNDIKRMSIGEPRDEAVGSPRQGERSSVDNVLRQIERLEKLKAAGHINDTEFASLKAAALKDL